MLKKKKKPAGADVRPTAHTTRKFTTWLRKVLQQDKTSRAGRSQKKWFMICGLQKWRWNMEAIWTNPVRNPPAHAAKAITTQSVADMMLV